MMTGNALAEIINVLSVIILGRLFSPAAFSVIAVYLTTATIISALAGGRYELAIMLPRKNSQAGYLLLSALFFLSVISLLSVIPFVFLNKYTCKLFKIYDYRTMFYFLPLTIFLMGAINSLNYWNSRLNKFSLQAKSKIWQRISQNTVSISNGFIHPSPWGLFAGNNTGLAIQFIYIYRKSKKALKRIYKFFNKQEAKQQLYENRNFPLFSVPLALLNLFSSNILIYVFPFILNSTVTGLYFNANKLIRYPLGFINSAFMNVFYKQLTESKNKPKLFIYTYFTSIIIGIIIMIPVWIFPEEIFSLLMGEEWKDAGKIAVYISPLVISGFATGNITTVISMSRKQKIMLIWQIIYLLQAILILFLLKDKELKTLLLVFSSINAFMFLILAVTAYIILLNFVKENETN